MFDFCLSKVPWRHDERSEGEEGSGNGHVAELGDDKTNEERDGVVCKEVVIGCKGTASRPSGP